MREWVAQLIMCDECCGENWDDVSRWVHEGRATAKSGTLRSARTCDLCEAAMPAGSSAEAVSLHGVGTYVPWEEEFLTIGTGWEEIEGGEERPGRES